jgi:recombination protein RecA
MTKPNPKAAALLAKLQKQFGEDKVMMASDIPVGPPIPTGSLALDFALGYGGFPSNRFVEVCGKEGTGKTTLALLAMLSALKMYPKKCAVFLDLEHKITPEWLETIVGKELLATRVIYLQPGSIEEATNHYRIAVESGDVCVVILDSIGGAPTVRRNEDATVGHYGGNAIGVGEFSRTAATLSAVHNCLTIAINQVRVDMSGYHSLNTPGGTALKHAVVLRVELVRGKETINEEVDGEKIPIGYTVYAKVRKNQVGAPGRTARWWFMNVPTEKYGFGVDTNDEIIRLGVLTGVFERSGAWYNHPRLPGGKVQGQDKLTATIKADLALMDVFAAEIRERLKGGQYTSVVAPAGDPDAPFEAPGHDPLLSKEA